MHSTRLEIGHDFKASTSTSSRGPEIWGIHLHGFYMASMFSMYSYIGSWGYQEMSSIFFENSKLWKVYTSVTSQNLTRQGKEGMSAHWFCWISLDFPGRRVQWSFQKDKMFFKPGIGSSRFWDKHPAGGYNGLHIRLASSGWWLDSLVARMEHQTNLRMGLQWIKGKS